MMLLQEIAKLLGGDVAGQQVLFPAPGHSPRDRSAALRFDPRNPGKFVVHSFAGDDWRLLRDHVGQRLGVASSRRLLAAPALLKPQPCTAARAAQALTIWDEACDPCGTPVEDFLRNRKVELPGDAIGEAVRFHPACPFAGTRTPAMVCLVRDIATNEPKAIHRTALSRDGCKVAINGHERLSLGPVAGGAIKLTPDEYVADCLGIGEGVESALSLRRTPEYGLSPVWSLISAGGIERFPVLAGIECLWIAVDHDETGLRAARSTGRRWRSTGAEVLLTTPSTAGSDLNDVLMGGGI